ncbi:putative glycolate dehydrogenase, 2-subunit type [Candidatus Syntrophocurvum alkaliphilum]|uniref:Glycolate oxidase iron-sulfur subunit n=1 Tax=Candidatus Syntrophocurvum alkaliphilum TaxID=2293317 RepID=A0A6I6DDV0_9FIRM|nr:(Fe-S)-binding protein [Candidatus Syntrophocurvum alkaliphilum]QGT99416.1 putative glycolate dehydrogenase, 2-subunit type [Candidatus Syntrophocurvum alkaliphilum]
MDFRKLPPVRDQIMKCVRCGKCRSVCPVFTEIRNETVSPRGHVFMVQMLRDNNVDPNSKVYEKIGSCLMCETCSVNCPSGIDVHELNAAARTYIYQNNPTMSKELIFDTLWTNPSLLKTSTFFMWGAQKTGIQKLARSLKLTKVLPGDLSKAEEILSDVPLFSAKSELSAVNKPKGQKRFTVGYFLGCATDLLNPNVAKATVEVLTQNGCEVIIPNNIKCCGLPQIANGKLDTARKLSAHNIKIFNSYDFDYIITDCASCSSALSKKHFEFLLGGLKIEDEAFKFAEKVIDLTKFLIDILDIKPPENGNTPKYKVTYHDPCHLANAQGIKNQPRELLKRTPGVEFVEMGIANRCCGGSGTYALTHYDLSMKILDKKMDSAMETGADKIATCCPSCTMQLKYGIKRHKWKADIVHPVELLNNSYQKAVSNL